MKNKIGCLLTILSIIALITGCARPRETSSIQNKLVGTWQWVRSDGGIAFHIHQTPANTGKNVDLKFTADGKYAIYTNDVLTSEGTYVLGTKKCIHDHADKTFVKFSSDGDMMVEKLDGDSLEFSDEAYDGVGSLYKRKNSNGN